VSLLSRRNPRSLPACRVRIGKYLLHNDAVALLQIALTQTDSLVELLPMVPLHRTLRLGFLSQLGD
jgi:hypothetical protein